MAQFLKSSQKSSQAKKAKIFKSNLNLKAQNIYTKPILKPQNTYNKPCFETAHAAKNAKNLHKQKVAQNVAISLSYTKNPK